MPTYADFVQGVDQNHWKIEQSYQLSKLSSSSERSSDESFYANSELFSHLTTDDIPQPKGKIFRRNR